MEAHDHRRGAEAGGGSARRFLEHALENGRESFGKTRGEAAPVLVVVQLLLRIRMKLPNHKLLRMRLPVRQTTIYDPR